jgi:hypothetical protein
MPYFINRRAKLKYRWEFLGRNEGYIKGYAKLGETFLAIKAHNLATAISDMGEGTGRVEDGQDPQLPGPPPSSSYFSQPSFFLCFPPHTAMRDVNYFQFQ